MDKPWIGLDWTGLDWTGLSNQPSDTRTHYPLDVTHVLSQSLPDGMADGALNSPSPRPPPLSVSLISLYLDCRLTNVLRLERQRREAEEEDGR